MSGDELAAASDVMKLCDAMIAAGELDSERWDFHARVAELRTLTRRQVSILLAEWSAEAERKASQ